MFKKQTRDFSTSKIPLKKNIVKQHVNGLLENVYKKMKFYPRESNKTSLRGNIT